MPPVPKTKRVKDPEAIEAARKSYCQVCYTRFGLHVHHIKTRGAGGGDIPENLICLCWKCHAKAHSGEINKDQLRRCKR